MLDYLQKKSATHLSLLILLSAAIFALAFAYISQYVFDHQPCILCLYQRKPLFAILAFSILALSVAKHFQKTFILLCLGCLFINLGLSFYHVGVEQKIFPGPSTCSSTTDFNALESVEELEAALAKTKAVRCDEPTFFFLGLTMAAWNIIYSLLLIFITYLISFKKIFVKET